MKISTKKIAEQQKQIIEPDMIVQDYELDGFYDKYYENIVFFT